MLIKNYQCNKCGEFFSETDCFDNPFIVKHIIGYGSKYDGLKLEYCLCLKCLDEFIDENKCKVRIISFQDK